MNCDGVIWNYRDEDEDEDEDEDLQIICLGSNSDSAINCHPSISQVGRLINVYDVPWVDVILDVLSADISWWTLKILRCSSRTIGELSLETRQNSKHLS